MVTNDAAPQKLAATNNSAATITAQALAQQLWEAACYEADADMSLRILLRICKVEGIELTEPEPGPDDDTYCSLCQSHNCGNNCDRAFERWADK